MFWEKASSAMGVGRKLISRGRYLHHARSFSGSRISAGEGSANSPPRQSADKISQVAASNPNPARQEERCACVVIKALRCQWIRFPTFACSTMTPFGFPVDPEV